MRIWINGQPSEVAEDTTVADALRLRDLPSSGVAVAVDGAVVPRADWAAHKLSGEAKVEVLTAVQGG